MISIIDSIGFVEANVFFSRPRTPRRVSVRVSSSPSASDAAAPGWECSSSRARACRPSSASAWLSLAHARLQARLHCGPVALGEMIQHISFLVPDTALHRHGAEDLIDGRSECL